MKKIFILNLILVILSSLIFSKIFLLYNNTLKNNDKWVVGKQLLNKGVFGANEFYVSRQALSKERLNLGAWHGFQEVIFGNQVVPAVIEFDFNLSGYSYLYFVFNKNDFNFSAVEFSANNFVENKYLESLTSGEFTRTETINGMPNFNDGKWHHVVFTFSDAAVILQIDDNFSASLPVGSIQRQFVGFRGSLQDASVDNVVINDQLTQKTFTEKFDNYKNWQSVLSVSLAIIIFANILIIVLHKKIKKENKRPASYRLVMLNLSLIFISSSYLIFIYAYFLDKYPSLDSLFSNLRAKEEQWVESEENRINDIISEKYSLESDKKRIIFIGTSQTHGAGALLEEEVFTNVLERKINKALGEQLMASDSAEATDSAAISNEYEIINAGVSGSQSTELLKFYKQYWINFKPELVFINLSTNDDNGEALKANLEEFIKINKEQNIETVLILEANSPEFSPDELFFHPLMKQVAEENDIEYLDMHQYLKLKNNTGILWWDLVHMTSYGQKLAAEYLYDEFFVEKLNLNK